MSQIDYLYQENKYVNSKDIKFDKNYLKKIWIKRVLTSLLFISIIIVGVFFIVSSDRRTVTINQVNYKYNKFSKTDIDIDDEVIFSSKELGILSTKLRINISGYSSAGKIISLPLSMVEKDNHSKHLEGNEYAIECIDGSCKPGDILIIKDKDIFGKVIEKNVSSN